MVASAKALTITGAVIDSGAAVVAFRTARRFLANINPANEQSIAFFKRHGGKLLQVTYEL